MEDKVTFNNSTHHILRIPKNCILTLAYCLFERKCMFLQKCSSVEVEAFEDMLFVTRDI